MLHYHVTENTPGYLPESDPATFTSKEIAGRYARFLAQVLRENGYRVSGNMRDGYYGTTDAKTYDLGRVISINVCSDICESGE